MTKLNKITFTIIFFVVCLFINSTTVSAATLNIRNLLKNGAQGNEVRLLQEQLNSTINTNLAVDGIFGSKTQAAVRQFQQQYDLAVDGIAGSRTCGKLNVAYLNQYNYVVVYVSPNENNGKLNVRSKATSNSAKLGTLSSGDVCVYYGTTITNGKTWYKIKYNGQYAYISGSYANKTGILLDLSAQTVKVYKDGKLKLEAPVITGNNGNNGTVSHKTPTGKYLFYSSNKTMHATLRGTNDDGSKYASDVTYWMPFITNRGIGFHDASWKTNSQFYDVNTYLSNGSHACVNMQFADAQDLYNLISSNIYVYVVE